MNKIETLLQEKKRQEYEIKLITDKIFLLESYEKDKYIPSIAALTEHVLVRQERIKELCREELRILGDDLVLEIMEKAILKQAYGKKYYKKVTKPLQKSLKEYENG